MTLELESMNNGRFKFLEVGTECVHDSSEHSVLYYIEEMPHIFTDETLAFLKGLFKDNLQGAA